MSSSDKKKKSKSSKESKDGKESKSSSKKSRSSDGELTSRPSAHEIAVKEDVAAMPVLRKEEPLKRDRNVDFEAGVIFNK